ncbi:MAG: toprim domain-containing protein, partial [Acetobacteraceae bacterium]
RWRNEGAPTPEIPAALSQAIPTPSRRTLEAPRRRAAPRFTEADAAADFAMALHRAGLRIAGPADMDGKMHRVSVEGDRKGQKSGTFVGHLDGWPAGYIRNYKTGTEIRWKADRPVLQMAPAERAAFAAEAAARSAERARERQDTQERAAKMAHRLWAAAAPATAHPYLAAKGVQAHGLRQDRRGRLLVPVQGADGRLWGVQRVDVDGSKLFLKGARTEGGHALIGGRPKQGAPLLVAEGYATGATLHEATGLPVVVAFHAGNLAAVAKAYRAADPSRPIIIAGDNDHHLPRKAVPLPNVGKEKAEAAAAAVGGVAVLPSFPVRDRGSDWNDLARRQGYQPIAAAVQGALDHVVRAAKDRTELAAVPAASRQPATGSWVESKCPTPLRQSGCLNSFWSRLSRGRESTALATAPIWFVQTTRSRATITVERGSHVHPDPATDREARDHNSGCWATDPPGPGQPSVPVA